METQCPGLEKIMPLIGKHWGFDELRPMQRESMEAILAGRDSVVVLPTGSGKSLCYQAPALLGRRATLVVSPLISLMKDQVDALNQRGIASAVLNSSLSPEHRAEVVRGIRSGAFRLIYVAPERFRQAEFLDLIAECDIRNFIIDEAHCVSHWGHEFREDYLRLDLIKRRFPQAAVHAFTATATRLVREDIAVRLQQRDPVMLVGSVDRPNLCFRVVPRRDALSQMVEIVERHKGEPGIVYCLRRVDTQEYAADLRERGYRAVPYHAGMTPEQRHDNQTAFASGEADIVVATVAFGMGIDRANVRYIIHAHMPKSIEHYQQEVGRAGRDGLPSECVLLHSAGDAVLWQKLQEGADTDDPEQRAHMQKRVTQMHDFCVTPRCRHAMIVEHFEQDYEPDDCAACDVCLHEAKAVEDADTIARKILSCVARVGQPAFGAGHIADILCGSRNAKITARGHDRLSTHGLLSDHDKREVRGWIDQLLGQGHLRRTNPPYHTLELNESSWSIMRGDISVLLTRSAATPAVAQTRRMVRSPAARQARDMFAKGASVERVAAEIKRATSTTWGYLATWVSIAKPESLRPWVTLEEENEIIEASTALGSRGTTPIFEKLGGRVPYEHIRLVLSHRYADAPQEATPAAV